MVHDAAMGKWVRIALAVVVASILAGLAAYGSEPSYDGRTLRDWVVAMRTGPDEDQARAVVRRLGTNSIPLLLDWLRRDERPSLTDRLRELKAGVNEWLARRRIIKSRLISMGTEPKPSYRSLGITALQELGPAGQAAIPTLILMLGDKKRKPGQVSEIAGAAYLVLPKMSPESIQPLTAALSSQDLQVYALAAGALSCIGPAARDAIPVLERKLMDKAPVVRVSAAVTIGKLGRNPEAVVPVLAQGFREGDWGTRSYILSVLPQYKENATSAVPALIEVFNATTNLSDLTNRWLHESIMVTLKQIDPEAAAKAGAQ
ncbi:conserved exported hypothetical protein [Verrucomicrobia bacterium]|nr:conserved exported hypothetical protein [Verrucomicrobiota bacterium]